MDFEDHCGEMSLTYAQKLARPGWHLGALEERGWALHGVLSPVQQLVSAKQGVNLVALRLWIEGNWPEYFPLAPLERPVMVRRA